MKFAENLAKTQHKLKNTIIIRKEKEIKNTDRHSTFKISDLTLSPSELISSQPSLILILSSQLFSQCIISLSSIFPRTPLKHEWIH